MTELLMLLFLLLLFLRGGGGEEEDCGCIHAEAGGDSRARITLAMHRRLPFIVDRNNELSTYSSLVFFALEEIPPEVLSMDLVGCHRRGRPKFDSVTDV